MRWRPLSSAAPTAGSAQGLGFKVYDYIQGPFACRMGLNTVGGVMQRCLVMVMSQCNDWFADDDGGCDPAQWTCSYTYLQLSMSRDFETPQHV